ncbi:MULTISPECIES: hypothetical protein [unclassified Spirosoma]|uniref:hypothetical protein n=1 Tax=unclassified Spirosoma TaxID=2621999 RepID=UPI000969217D|nr:MULTISPECIES: hypothetical protein [unclassified Spirosoma]MBN8825299.1 hypothetical protein [Spirosoma sp.]OJW77527.1 MAG: hypothetical protein BGO59_01290 [Spirosoma sp. 48-14]
MKKVLSIGFFILIVYHTLAYMLVAIASWWQAEHDLSERLLVYRSVDSLVEFQIPLKNKFELNDITHTTSDGFTYRGHYYSVVSMEVREAILYIAGLEMESHSVWQHDLLSFLNDHISEASESQRKANRFLKFLLKEYSPTPRVVFYFLTPHWRKTIRIPDLSFVFLARSLPIHSPPPEC